MTQVIVSLRHSDADLTFRCRYWVPMRPRRRKLEFDVGAVQLIEASLIAINDRPPSQADLEAFAAVEDSPDFWTAFCEAVAKQKVTQ